MGVILTKMLLRKRPGFAARKDFIPTVQQQGCVLQAPEAQQAQHTWAGEHLGSQMNGQSPSSSPQGSTGTYWSSTGATRCELDSSASRNRHFSALIFNCWVGLVEWWAPYSSFLNTHQGLRDATEVTILLPYVCAFIWIYLWLLPTWLRWMWPAGSSGAHRMPVGCSPSLWEDGVLSTQQEVLRANASATSATLLSYFNTHSSKMPAGFPEGSVNWKAVWKSAFFDTVFWRCNCQMRGMWGWPGLPSGHQSLLPPLGTDSRRHEWTRAHEILSNSKPVLSSEGNAK